MHVVNWRFVVSKDTFKVAPALCSSSCFVFCSFMVLNPRQMHQPKLLNVN